MPVKNQGRRGGLRLLPAVPLLLLLALLLGALVPRNAGHVEPAQGIDIWVGSSPVHSEIILPMAAAGHDWRRRIAPDQFADGRGPGAHVSLSWGERDFFLATPTWADFNLGMGLKALFASEASLLRAYRLDVPPAQWIDGSVRIRLTEAQYRRLVAGIERHFTGGPAIAGHGPDDVFHPAYGRYSAVHSCNQWTANRLAEAGVRVGRWTPFAASLMKPLAWHYGRDQ